MPAAVFAVLMILAVIGIVLDRILYSVRQMWSDLMEVLQVLLYVGGGVAALAVIGYFTLQVAKVRASRDLGISDHIRQIELHERD